MAYKILIPLDGSRLAEHSLSYLRALKDLDEEQIELMSVADVEENYRGLAEENVKDREINVLRDYLKGVQEKAKRQAPASSAAPLPTRSCGRRTSSAPTSS